MSKNNSEKIESELEASNVFTLKGEDEAQIEQSANIDIETNKKSHEPQDSPNEVIITNLTNYSFGIPEHEHEYSSDNGEINESIKGFLGPFQSDKKSISPKRRKYGYDSVLKITFTKNNRGKIIKVLRKELKDKKVLNKNMTINDKEIDNLLEATNTNINNNEEEPSEDNKMELENEEKKDQIINHSDEIVQEENDNSISDHVEHNEFDKKVKDDFNNNNINIKENSSDMIIEPENSDEHEKENANNNENEINNINGGVSENVLNDISRLTLENGLNKIIKDQLENKNNIEINKEEQEDKKEEEIIREENAEAIRKENEDKNVIKEEKEEKKIMNSKKYNDKENKIMANEDINMKDKPKSKEIEKILENKDKKENDKEKKNDEIKAQSDKLYDAEECNEKNDIAKNINNNINEYNSFDQAIEDLIAEVNKENDNEDTKEKEKDVDVANNEDVNNINNKKLECIKDNENKNKEKENKEEEKEIKEEKKEESNQILANANIFQNQYNIVIDKLINEKINAALKGIFKDNTNNTQAQFNSKQNINTQIKEEEKEKEEENYSNNIFLGKKREKISSNSLDNQRKSNSVEKKEEEIKNKSDINNNEDTSLGKMLEKHIFNYLYEKIMTKSLSEDSDLEKKINNFIKEKGYSKVKSSLINAKKEKEKKENINPSVQKKELDEIHYSFVNNFYHRFKSIKTKDGFQTYICCDKECKGLAKLNIKERKFEVIQSHTVPLKDHLHFNDDRPVFFMKSRKLDEVHIKKNEHNEKYHLEWFN